MSLHAIVDAHNQGYDENMYLDAKTRTKVEETGGANFIFVTKGRQGRNTEVRQHPSFHYKTFPVTGGKRISRTGSRRKRSIF